ncbi:T9SS type A sorting domain-containing protein [Maribellus comscasis]|uniref:T9SS type A sorting domain-containing protein n=1 Tax=Maribellus comscasis TaxID=2681766 RepID=A0A6I6JRJ0_9BACT|nr:T9SS type A sorting domain-containing protein [Maribellus comscasis]QGY45031.1 T9SS type A sorting domain-containing protein [Maribellus comscasis]
MKKLLISSLLTLVTYALQAQEVISPSGLTQQTGGYVISWTVGEPVINKVSKGNTILTQGFHQSKLIITAVEELIESINQVNVFPNPTAQFAIIKFDQLPEKNIYHLFDINGKLLSSKEIKSTETQIDLTPYANGSYLLKIIQEDNLPIQTFKIFKQ